MSIDVISCSILVIALIITSLSMLSNKWASFFTEWTFYIVKDQTFTAGQKNDIQYIKPTNNLL